MHCERPPAIQDWIAALQNCRQKKNLGEAKCLYACLRTEQLETHPVLCNYLVPALVECGGLCDARQVFDSLSPYFWNHHSWNSLIAGYIHHGEPQDAINLYWKMDGGSYGIQPDTVTYLVILVACAKLKVVENGKEIHAKIIQRGFEKDPFLGNTLVDMYGKCSSLADARCVFDELPVRDSISWNALVTGYADHGEIGNVEVCIRQMLLEGACLYLSTLVCGLRACANGGDLTIGQELHTVAVKRGWEKHLFVGSTLVDVYSKHGLFAEAQIVFDWLPARDVVAWAALTAGYAEHGLGEEVRDCYQQMLSESISPDSVTIICSLKACGTIGDLTTGRVIHMEAIKRSFESELNLGNMLVDLYGKCNSFDEANQVFHSLRVRDIVSWNSLISGYADHGPGVNFSKWFEQMLLEGISPQPVTYVCSLKACGAGQYLEEGRIIHGDAVKKGLELEAHVSVAVVVLYTEHGSFAEALKVFDKLPVRNRIIWNALIAGYAEHGFSERALDCLQLMLFEGVSPDSITISCCLKACDGIEALETGLDTHFEATKRGFEQDIHVGSTLVDMYMGCGLADEARHEFDLLPFRTPVSWNVLLNGYLECGRIDEVEACFQLMQMQAVSPDALTFVCILKSFAITQTAEKGQELHLEIVKMGFESDAFVSNTLLSMYTEHGSLEEAYKLLHALPIRSTTSWNILIGGYAEKGLGEEGCVCFQLMVQEGLSPDCVTFVVLLKSCGSLQALIAGEEIHTEVTKLGFESDIFVGSALMAMYMEHTSYLEAHNVLSQLPVQTSAVWNALIDGYAEHDLYVEALNCFQEMLMKGFSPDDVTFICTLKACSIAQDLQKGCKLHCELLKRGFESELYVGSTLVDMYTACGSLSEAHQVLYRLPARNAVSWNALIARYADCGLDDEASDCFKQLLLEGLPPDSLPFNCTLKSCGLSGDLEAGRGIHMEASKRGIECELYVGNALFDMYIKFGFIAEAQKVFDRLFTHDANSWNLWIAGLTEHGLGEKAGKAFQQMHSDGVLPSVWTFACCLKACIGVQALDTGQEVHAEIMKRGLETDSQVGSMLVDMYVKCDALEEARQVLSFLPVHCGVSWDALLAGLSNHGLNEDMKDCFQKMQEDGVCPDSVTYISCLKSCGIFKALAIGQHFHAEIAKRGLDKDLYVGSTLVDMYSDCGSLAEGCHVFDILAPRNVVTWNALIAGLAEYGRGEEAVNYLRQMLEEGISPSPVTFVCSLKACGAIQAVETCHEIHMEIAKKGLEREAQVGSALVHVYIECGSLAEAHQVFSKMPVRSIISWNAMIAGYAEHLLCEEAWKSFQQMQLEDITPDCTTFVFCLKACGNVAALGTGREVHLEVAKRAIEWNSHVGSMLVDMYGSCSSIVEAQRVFDMLLIKSVVLWTAMIKAYGNNHQGEMAVQCFEDMQAHGVKPTSVTFICLLAACCHSSLVTEGQEYFGLMRRHGIKPTVEHYACMVDLFSRSGCIQEAEKFFAAMDCPPSNIILRGMLSACKIYGKVELGSQCFNQLAEADEDDSSAQMLIDG